MKKEDFQKRFVALSSLCLLEGLILTISLVVTPADPKNAIFLGFSLKRWVLLGSILISQGVIVLLLLIFNKTTGRDVIYSLLRSKVVLIFFLLAFFSLLSLIVIYSNYSLFLWLSPILVYSMLLYGSLVSLQVIIFQLISFPNIESFGNEMLNWFKKKNFFVWITLLGAIPLLFATAIKQDFPLGFAGLYSLMAEKILDANFYLPLSVPYYGPGGIPFAYPPFGLYIMAIFLKLGISTWSYLRFAPPVFSLLALMPLFLLTRRISKSNLGGMIAVLLAAGSFYLFYLQTESGGVIRGLAFGLGLMSLNFLDRMFESFHWRDIILAGVFFGLTVLTHLGYSFYFALWFLVWILTHPGRKNWFGACIAVGISILVALPWIIIISVRYGVSVFSNALLSHDNSHFLSFIQNPNSLFPALQNNLQSIFESPIMIVLVAAGLVYLVVTKKFTLPLLFLLILIIFQRQDHYILTISFIIVGVSISFLYRFIESKIYLPNKILQNLVFSIILFGLFFPGYIRSYLQLSEVQPLINNQMLDVGLFMRSNTLPQASYLSLFTDGSQADEWLPYISQRDPVLVLWGTEWTGTYVVQSRDNKKLVECIDFQSISCLEDWFVSTGRRPNYLIMSSSLSQLSSSLEKSTLYEAAYVNSSYMVWEHR